VRSPGAPANSMSFRCSPRLRSARI
jgi:hypothetical protein